MKPFSLSPFASTTLACLIALVLTGCGAGGSAEDAEVKLPSTPAEAATRVEEVFASADPAMKETASAASEAVRTGNYEKAVVALQSLQAGKNATLEQGLAVHGYLVTLESTLINAAESGDERARRAYELLRQMKRK